MSLIKSFDREPGSLTRQRSLLTDSIRLQRDIRYALRGLPRTRLYCCRDRFPATCGIAPIRQSPGLMPRIFRAAGAVRVDPVESLRCECYYVRIESLDRHETPSPPVDRLPQLLDAGSASPMIVHPAREGIAAILVERVGGDRNDRQPSAFPNFRIAADASGRPSPASANR